jgi:hypothetical protein
MQLLWREGSASPKKRHADHAVEDSRANLASSLWYWLAANPQNPPESTEARCIPKQNSNDARTAEDLQTSAQALLFVFRCAAWRRGNRSQAATFPHL